MSVLQILAIGDPHFKVDNAEESEHFHHQVSRWLDDHPVDFIVILGDILHSHEKIYTFAMNTAVKFIKMCSTYAPVYCLVGNHDATSNTIYCSSNHWLKVLDGMDSNINIVEKPTFLTDSNVLCCPYVSDGRFIEMLEQYVDGWQDTDVIFAHQLFDGGKMGAIVANNVEKWNEAYPLIISGHLHDRQQPQTNLYYAGSSQHLAFSESADKSLALVKVDDTDEKTKVTWEEIYLELKQRKTMYCSVEEVSTIKLQANIQYKIVIKDEDATIKAFKKSGKYKELQSHPQVRSVQFKLLQTDKEEKAEFNNDFLTTLHAKLQAENLYMQSYANHLLTGSEDMSDKDVVLV